MKGEMENQNVSFMYTGKDRATLGNKEEYGKVWAEIENNMSHCRLGNYERILTNLEMGVFQAVGKVKELNFKKFCCILKIDSLFEQLQETTK